MKPFRLPLNGRCGLSRPARRLLLSLAVCATFCPAASAEQPPQFRWALQLTGSGTGQVFIHGQCIDALGNNYLTGSFRGDAQIGATTLTNGGIFLAKIDRSGAVIWARQDGAMNSKGYSVAAIGPESHLHILADIQSFSGPVPIAGTNLSADMVLATYTTENGEGCGACPVAAGSPQPTSGLTVDTSDRAFWTGWIANPTTFGTTNLAVTGWGNGVLARVDPDGTVAWVKAVRGPANTLTSFGPPRLDNAGNIFVCGNFSDAADLETTNLTSQGSADIFLAKYTPDGILLWAKQAGGVGSDYTYALAVDPFGNGIISGVFSQTTTFGDVTLSNAVATNFYFVAKYNSDGAVLWARQVCEGASRFGVASDLEGNVYFAGESRTNTCFVKFSSDGDQLWTKLSDQIWIQDLHADAMGHCYLAGQIPQSNAYLAKLDTTTLPRLNMHTAGESIVVSWPVLADGFHLEAATDLSLADAWRNNLPLPQSTGMQTTVTLPAAEKMFFRLVRP